MQVLEPRDVPLGGLRALMVRRTLPHRDRSFIGAWCFVDHYGPTAVGEDGAGRMDVAPHPHTGLQTVSWLFEGEIEHRDSGAVHAMVRPREVNLMTAGRGVDVVYDPVGGDLFEASLRAVAWNARLVVIGFAAGKVQQIPANILLVKNVTVIGFYYGYWNGWGGKGTPSPKEAEALAKRRALVAAAQQDLSRWFTEGKLKATVAATYDLADWVKAFRLIEERTVVGKAVLVP